MYRRSESIASPLSEQINLQLGSFFVFFVLSASFFYKSVTCQERLDLPLPLYPLRRRPPLARHWLDLL